MKSIRPDNLSFVVVPDSKLQTISITAGDTQMIEHLVVNELTSPR